MPKPWNARRSRPPTHCLRTFARWNRRMASAGAPVSAGTYAPSCTRFITNSKGHHEPSINRPPKAARPLPRRRARARQAAAGVVRATDAHRLAGDATNTAADSDASTVPFLRSTSENNAECRYLLQHKGRLRYWCVMDSVRRLEPPRTILRTSPSRAASQGDSRNG